MAYEEYRARASSAKAASPFTIDVRFLGGLTATQQNAFKAAADRWVRAIIGDLPNVFVSGEVVDDLLILAQGTSIDGPGGILGQAGPTHLRPQNAGTAALLPAKGLMSFDTADLAAMEANGTLNDVITHEMGHVLGIGTLWDLKEFLRRPVPSNPIFVGPSAMAEFGVLRGTGPTPVPVANVGGPGTFEAHWRESVFANELMTGVIGAAGNPMSRMTIASLKDLGYEVDLDAAEPFSLPTLLMLGELGLLAAHDDHGGRGTILSTSQILLPEDSLR